MPTIHKVKTHCWVVVWRDVNGFIQSEAYGYEEDAEEEFEGMKPYSIGEGPVYQELEIEVCG